MKRLIALVLYVTVAVPLYAQSNVVFQDDYSDNRNSWWEGSNSDYFFKVTNGTYVFDNFSQTTYTIAKNVGLTQDDDFTIETTIRKISGVDNQVYGLVWGYQDADNCYTFSLSGNGYYLVGKWTGGTWGDLIAWTTSSSIVSYSGYAVTNRLKVEKTGDRVDFYINDTYVNSYAWERPVGSQVGYVVTKTQRIEIDDLVVRKPGGAVYGQSGQSGAISSWDNPYGHSSTIRSVAFSRDGSLVASVDESTQIKVWDVRSGVATQTLTVRPSVSDIGFSADATKAIWWDSENNVGFYDLASGSDLARLRSSSTYGATWATPFAISADGQLGAYRDQDFDVIVVSAYSGNVTSVLRGSQNVYSMAFGGDGRTIAVGYAAANISIWDAYSGELRRTLMGHETYYTRAIAVSWDASLVASAGDMYCKISEINSGRDVALLNGHSEAIDVIAFSPDSRFIATGSTDNSVRIWDVQSGSELRRFTDATGDIKALAFSPDGQTLACGGQDHTIRIWNISELSGGGYQGGGGSYGQQTVDAWTMGSQAFDQGDFQTAMSYFQQALSTAEQNQNLPGQADALVSIGITLERLGQLDQAREYCWRAIQTGAGDHRSYYTLAKIAYDQGNYSEAQSISQDGLSRYPDNPDLKRVLSAVLTVSAHNYYNTANYADAVNLYVQSVQLYDQDATVFMWLGYSYYAMGQYGQAATALERAEQLNQNIGQENSTFYEILNYCRNNR